MEMRYINTVIIIIIIINVGGHLFSTSLATLNKDPGDFK